MESALDKRRFSQARMSAFVGGSPPATPRSTSCSTVSRSRPESTPASYSSPCGICGAGATAQAPTAEPKIISRPQTCFSTAPRFSARSGGVPTAVREVLAPRITLGAATHARAQKVAVGIKTNSKTGLFLSLFLEFPRASPLQALAS